MYKLKGDIAWEDIEEKFDLLSKILHVSEDFRDYFEKIKGNNIILEKHSYRVGEYEFRTCDKHLISEGELIKAEIVSWWSDKFCYTVAIFENDWDSWHIVEVGDRLLKCISDVEFQEVYKYGHKFFEGIIGN